MSAGEPDEPHEAGETPKPLFWMGGSLNDTGQFPDEVKQVIGFALYQAQTGGKHVSAKPLKGFGGAGVLEIVAEDDGSTYRGVYTVKFPGAVYVLDAFQKKSKKGARTPRADVNRIIIRLKAAEEHYRRWRLTQKEEDE
jgi:phage-related protein